jgi:thiol-disulfide isomerase/thioredoxin
MRNSAVALARIAIVILTIALVAGCSSPPPEQPATSAADELAHVFALATTSGETLSLDEFAGRWVVVSFWATWCGPCVEEMPYLDSLARDEPDLAVLGINMRESREVVEAFAAEHALHLPLLLDPDDATLSAYQVMNLPLTVVVSPDGSIAGRFFGPLEPESFGVWLREASGRTGKREGRLWEAAFITAGNRKPEY